MYQKKLYSVVVLCASILLFSSFQAKHVESAPTKPWSFLSNSPFLPGNLRLDSDGDGVENQYDRCPDTPAGVPVGADGCPEGGGDPGADQDGDGVGDFQDACPNTPLGTPVNSVGCPL